MFGVGKLRQVFAERLRPGREAVVEPPQATTSTSPAPRPDAQLRQLLTLAEAEQSAALAARQATLPSVAASVPLAPDDVPSCRANASTSSANIRVA